MEACCPHTVDPCDYHEHADEEEKEGCSVRVKYVLGMGGGAESLERTSLELRCSRRPDFDTMGEIPNRYSD